MYKPKTNLAPSQFPSPHPPTNLPTTPLITHPPNLETPAILIRRRATHAHHIPRLKHRRVSPVHHLAAVVGEECDLGNLLPLRTVVDADVGGAADGTPFVAVFGRQDVVTGAEIDVAGGVGTGALGVLEGADPAASGAGGESCGCVCGGEGECGGG